MHGNVNLKVIHQVLWSPHSFAFGSAVRSVKCERVGSTGTREARRSDHHCSGLQRVARASPVVPFDPVEAISVLAQLVILPVQVGRTAGIKPPT